MTYLALFSWPVVTIILFRLLPVATAVICSMIGAYLLLPTDFSIDLPVLPAIDKNFVPSLTLVIAGVVLAAQQANTSRRAAAQEQPAVFFLPGWLPKDRFILALCVLLVLGSLATGLTNGEPLNYGGRRLPGLQPYDAFSLAMVAGVGLLPFLLGRKFLAHPDSHAKILLIFFIAGLLYSLPTLYEVRMSPQLNRMVYGYFPHSWQQHLRGDGYRPVVFLGHGLWLGIFLSMSLLATLAMIRLRQEGAKKLWYLVAAFWLFATLLLSKNLGALIITCVLGPVVLLFGVRMQMLAAAALAVVVILYPALRGNDLIPTERIVSMAATISPERAGSLQFRFDNEDALLEKANRKPVVGWGGWGRSRLFDEQGRSITTVDGRWIIAIGQGGWVRYLTEFGLLTLPIILLALRRRRLEVSAATSLLCLVMAANLVDLLPNASLTSLSWLLAGAVAGRLELGRVEAGASLSETAPSQTGTAYSRFPAEPARGTHEPARKTPRRGDSATYARHVPTNTRIKDA